MSSQTPQPSINLHRRAAEIVRTWSEHGAADAAQAIRENPDFASNKSLVVELALAEFAIREKGGERLDVEEFCGKFPRYHATIGRLLNNQSIMIEIDAPKPNTLAMPGLQELPNATGIMHPSDSKAPKISDKPSGSQPAAKPSSSKPIGEGTPIKGSGHIPEVGDRVGDFTLLRQLGRGAFALVFLALEETTNRYVVVKLSKVKCDEARVLGQLKHPHIVEIHAAPFDRDSGLYLVSMPFQGGATLEDLLEVAFPKQGNGTPPVYGATILEASRRNLGVTMPQGAWGHPDPFLKRCSYIDGIVWLSQRMTSALIAVHQAGYVHHDLKPSNVLLGADGWPRLMDFNLASHQGDTKSYLGGTLPYMAPEILEEIATPGQRLTNKGVKGDIYSLGVIIFELLAGLHPFGRFPKARTLREGVRQVLEKQKEGAKSLHALVPGLPNRLCHVVERCLAFEPSKRFDNAEELLNELNRCHTNRQRVRELINGRPAQVATMAILAGSALLGAAGAFARNTPEKNDVNNPLGNYANRGLEQYNAGRYQEAIANLNMAIETEPTRAELWTKRGKARAAVGETLAAQTDLLVAVKNGDTSANTQAVLGWTYAKNFQTQQSFDCLNLASEQGVTSHELLFVKTVNQAYLRSLKMVPEIQSAIEKLVASKPTDVKARWFRGYMYYTQAVSQKAVVDQKVIDDLEAILTTPEATCEAFHTAFMVWSWNAMKHADLGRGEAASAARAKALVHLIEAAKRGFDPESMTKAPVISKVFNPKVDFASAIAAKKGTHRSDPFWYLPNIPKEWME